MGGHSLFFLVLLVIAASCATAFFALLLRTLRPLAGALQMNALARSQVPFVRGTPEQEATWNKLRIDAEVSAASPSHESLEKSRHARADLLASDPAFDPETFLQRAETAYLLIKRALLMGQTAALRAYVHPSLYALTVAEAEQIAASSIRVRTADIAVERVFAQSVESGVAGDRIWVHFDVKTRAQYVDVQSGAIVADMGASTGFGEQCLFVRNAGIKTAPSGGVFAQKCPACGAPLALSSDGCCFYCKAEVSTGAHDWTLAAAVPVPYDEAKIDVLVDETLLEPAIGFSTIRMKDPDFSSDRFQERIASAFEALETAIASGDLENARPFMSQGLYLAWSMQAEQTRAAGNTNALDGLEVYKLAPASVRCGESFDDVTLRIDGIRARYVLDAHGQLFSGSKQREPFSELWTFQRSANAKSLTAAGAFERQCPNCGAPVSVNAAGECAHCNAAITNGAFDWVLSRVVVAEANSSLVRAGAK